MKLKHIIKLSAIGIFVFFSLAVYVKSSSAQTCTDSDGGLDYYQSGEVTTSTGVFSDYCSTYTSVREYYCDGLAPNSEIYNCSGQGVRSCFNGECCSWVGESCTNDDDCCTNYTCDAGTCVSPDIILLDGLGTNCADYCILSGFSGCSSVGTDTSGLNGLISFYKDNMCVTETYYSHNCDIVMYSSNNFCDGHKTDWTYCRCYTGNYPPPLPTPTLSPSLTPNPELPTPFLELPWDYEGKGSFEQVALNPNSWFDHKYPLQDLPCCDPPVTNYTGKSLNQAYQHHNGYDFGQNSGVFLNTPVLAAESGWATLKLDKNSGGAGNVIKINHGNGYQTWYEHLSSDGLIVQNESDKVYVEQGQVIGKVGMTGYTNGPHIHFSVFKDTDGDGFFDDEIPLGVTDPLGWEGLYSDPWPTDKGGAESYNLYKARAKPQPSSIPISGGNLNTGKVEVVIPGGAAPEPFILTFLYGPFEATSDLFTSVVPSFFLSAVNNLGQKIFEFIKPITFSFDYSEADLSNVDENSLTFYTFDEPTGDWNLLSTTLDKNNHIAYSETTHFSQFALMGQKKDITPPTTLIYVSGNDEVNGWYKSDVTVELIGEDNDGGIGLQYTLYSLNGSDWFEYKEPIVFTDNGEHEIIYQSFDKAENTEERKTYVVDIDKTAPAVAVSKTPDANLNGWNNSDVTIHFDCSDSGSGVDTVTTDVVLTDEGENQTVKGTCSDKAGNTSGAEVTGINIDKTNPEITASKSPEANENGWNNSDVTIRFDCTDSLSGVDCITEDQIVSSEGRDQSIDGTCSDKAGNITSITVGGINIDKNNPGLIVQFNPQTRTIDYLGSEANQTNVKVTNLFFSQRILMSDDAGNTTEVVGNRFKLGALNTFSFRLIRYNGGDWESFDRNLFTIFYLLNKDRDYYSINQVWTVKDGNILLLNYKGDTNKTFVFTKEAGIRYPKEIKDGLVLLFIKTNNGNLEYGY